MYLQDILFLQTWALGTLVWREIPRFGRKAVCFEIDFVQSTYRNSMIHEGEPYLGTEPSSPIKQTGDAIRSVDTKGIYHFFHCEKNLTIFEGKLDSQAAWSSQNRPRFLPAAACVIAIPGPIREQTAEFEMLRLCLWTAILATLRIDSWFWKCFTSKRISH